MAPHFSSDFVIEVMRIVGPLARAVAPIDRGSYYVGITDDLERSLMEHHVDPHTHEVWTTRTDREDIAVAVEMNLREMGFQGDNGPGEANEDSVYLYLYRMTPQTSP